MEVTLCQTCAVEHATDTLGVQCSKRGLKYIQTECQHYKPTREKLLEDALRGLVDALYGNRKLTKRALNAFDHAFVLLGKCR
jgi:hypothetical protein